MPCHIRELEQILEGYRKITVDPQCKEPLYIDERADPTKSNNILCAGWYKKQFFLILIINKIRLVNRTKKKPYSL